MADVEIDGEAALEAISMANKGVMINGKWFTVVGPAANYMKNLKKGGLTKYKIIKGEVVFIQPIGQPSNYPPKPQRQQEEPQSETSILTMLDEHTARLRDIQAKLEVFTPPGQIDIRENEQLHAFLAENQLIEAFEEWKAKKRA